MQEGGEAAVVMETAAVVMETAAVVMETAAVVMETAAVVMETAAVVMETAAVVMETAAVVMETAAVVMETAETGEAAQSGATVQPVPAIPSQPVLTGRRFRRNSGKMNSQRPRSPQNRVPQPAPRISPGTATLIRPGSSGFLFCSR